MAPTLAAAQVRSDSALDSTFILATNDPARAPSPFIGNGRIGLVVPALGLAPARSFVAGLYEHGPADVPRIISIPAWNGIEVFDGERWLGDSLPAGDSIRSYRQTIDMRTGTASTRYERVSGSRRLSVGVETFVSRAAPRLAATRIELTPAQAGRMQVRFELAEWPPPPRLPLDTLKRIEPTWGPKEIWYPGHAAVRSRAATARPGVANLSLTARPAGRTSTLAEAAAVNWPADLPGARAHTRTSRGGATVEVAFDAVAGAT
jgi:protein-glucosylgalactosylhydroxylysine glucosidase